VTSSGIRADKHGRLSAPTVDLIPSAGIQPCDEVSEGRSTMNRLMLLRVVLGVWVAWHLLFGILSTFAPEAGANAVGWSAAGGWDADLITMSTQYGMVMVLLAGMYFIMALEPLRYLGLIWVAVGEQALGIAYATYIFATYGQITPAQMALQTAINIVVILIFIALWSGLRNRGTPAMA
jgi:hypothetical protein